MAWPSPSQLCASADQHEAPEHALTFWRALRAESMVTLAQAQVQAEHSSAEGRLQTWPSFCLLLTGRAWGWSWLCQAVILPNDSCSGCGWPEISQEKEEEQNPPSLVCLPHHARDCSGWGMASPVEWGLLAQGVR